jgi:hypothetical protein
MHNVVLDYIKDSSFVVEATSMEQSQLWEQYNKKGLIFSNAGYGITVGNLNDRPICISITKATYKGKNILIWEATSQLVDYMMIEDFFKKTFNEYKKADAQNFHNCIHYLNELVKNESLAQVMV